MKGFRVVILTSMVFVGFLVASCSIPGILGSPEDTVREKAEGLLDQVRNFIESSGSLSDEELFAELSNLASSVVYVPPESEGDADIEYWIDLFSELLGLAFFVPATPTSVDLLDITPVEGTRFINYRVDDKPSFIDEVYFLTLEKTTTDGTKTVLQLPMIIVEGNSYFFTLYVGEGDTPGSTDVKWYPMFMIGL
ncbi:hypothetical protein [Thermotoga sp. KOL6]|uniref:hypothetical protein n=1 Tax=Thermotoga sp. KOL6 TaxID=126741 RepID=UPI000C75F4B7|nr:hypothetical protein [Thermotoga sp. KOL6]PLV60324.1 hypothetical protein AS005_03305 [Thermotoga sp. KOL6]